MNSHSAKKGDRQDQVQNICTYRKLITKQEFIKKKKCAAKKKMSKEMINEGKFRIEERLCGAKLR